MPGRHLSRHADPDQALPPGGDEPANEPVTPFKLSTRFDIVKGTLPKLRFGRRYRLRARAVDLAGGGLRVDEPTADELAESFALPRDPEGFAYLRYEPVAAPLVVMRDASAVTGPGSAVDRLVIRTSNGDPAEDTTPADLRGSQRHILPPRASVELGERLGMFDTPTGELRSDAATWQLIADRDAAELKQSTIEVAGATSKYPLERVRSVDPLPYLPDASGTAPRSATSPGRRPGRSAGRRPAAGPPRRSSTRRSPIPTRGRAPPLWSPSGRAATGRGCSASAWCRGAQAGRHRPAPVVGPGRPGADRPAAEGHDRDGAAQQLPDGDDLKLMGQWQWLREYIERITVSDPEPQHLIPGSDADRIAHVLQRAVEGGHWLLTPPRLLTLVHAVQQPIGRPEFRPLDVEHDPERSFQDDPLQTKPIAGRHDPTELAPVTAWRRPGATDAYLMGALRVHGASTAKVDLARAGTTPSTTPRSPAREVAPPGHVDELPLPELRERYLAASGPDLVASATTTPSTTRSPSFGRATGRPAGRPVQLFLDAAPRHVLGDTKHHRVTYTAMSTSRYREYFPQDLDFTRASEPVVVDVPASARPVAPTPSMSCRPSAGSARSRRTSSGASASAVGCASTSPALVLLGRGRAARRGALEPRTARSTRSSARVQALHHPVGHGPDLGDGQPLRRSVVRQLPRRRGVRSRSDARGAGANRRGRARVDVVGFRPEFDEERGLWFADLTIDTCGPTYMPFVRLALVRYQPTRCSTRRSRASCWRTSPSSRPTARRS